MGHHLDVESSSVNFEGREQSDRSNVKICRWSRPIESRTGRCAFARKPREAYPMHPS